MDPFLASALVNTGASFIGNILGKNAAQSATRTANQASRAQNKVAWERNVKQAKNARAKDIKTMKMADRMSDQNVAQANKTNLANYALQRTDQREDSRTAYDRSVKSSEQARAWAEEDYARAKSDQASQYTDLRAAAEKGGFNPLSVLGTGMTPTPAGGITASTFAASPGVGLSSAQAMSVQGVQASVPMGYGAPVVAQPLASNDAILGSVAELGQELTGAAAVGRANDQLYSDIAAIELDRLRGSPSSQYPVVPPRVDVAPSLGPTATRVGNTASTPGMTPFYGGNLYQDMGLEIDPVIEIPLFNRVRTPDGQVYNTISPGGDFDLDSAINAGLQIGVQKIMRDTVEMSRNPTQAVRAVSEWQDRHIFGDGVTYRPSSFSNRVPGFAGSPFYR